MKAIGTIGASTTSQESARDSRTRAETEVSIASSASPWGRLYWSHDPPPAPNTSRQIYNLLWFIMLGRSPRCSSRIHALIRPRILPKQRRKGSSGSAASIGRRFLPLSIDHVEEIEEYRPGGYHPVHLGDTFNGRYKVIHKLGSGGLSTTWLARDQTAKRYRAIKILKADETAMSTELRTLQWLASLQTDNPGTKHIRRLDDNFVIHGPNGNHTCLVTDAAGPSLQDLYNVTGSGYAAGSRRLRADIARTVARQVVEAVDLLHSQRVCHGGNTYLNRI